MRTIIKKGYAILMALVCLSPIFSSCEEDATTTYQYVVTAKEVFPVDKTSVAIAKAVIKYQTEAGLLDKTFTESVKKDNLTDEEKVELDKTAGDQATKRLGDCNFAQIVQKAGITVPSNQKTIEIYYTIGYPTTNGSIIKRGTLVLKIKPEVLK